MITTILLAFLVPVTLAVIGWAYKMSLAITVLTARQEIQEAKIVRLERDVKENDTKYVQILSVLTEIKVELQNKQNRKDN